ncbi:MAG TPA: acyl-CoA dehydrogenase family protein [Tepidiformaceae bacterium]|nr:acyl-CoA dehydrogenase family protein [Tepidiformaceae bacterium]
MWPGASQRDGHQRGRRCGPGPRCQGYRRDQRVEKWVRHARIVQFLDGTNLVHRMVPGRALAAPPKRG